MADADRIFVARGRKIVVHDGDDGPTPELMAMVMGPSGNLRVPTLKVGKDLVVGFNEELYEDFF